jgi:aspartate carbamoyltransferase regulatory subunit
MNVDGIYDGIVIDHIKAGRSMDIYHYLHLEKLDCCIAIIKNVRSSKYGKKDIIKIDAEFDVNLDILGYIDPNITVNIIKTAAWPRRRS